MTPAGDVNLHLGRGASAHVLVKVVATTPGQVDIHGIEVDYSDGWRLGTQSTGVNVDITAR